MARLGIPGVVMKLTFEERCEAEECIFWDQSAKEDWDNPAFCSCGLAKLLTDLYAYESSRISS